MKKKISIIVALILTLSILVCIAVPTFANSGHTANWVKYDTPAATCKSTVEQTYICTVCGETKTVKETNTNPIAHTYSEGVGYKAATCTEDGFTGILATCSVCGNVLALGETIPATGHNFVNGVCTVCGEKQTCTTHKWDAGTVTKEATCTTAGTKKYTCTVCGETKTEVILPAGHKYDSNGICTVCQDKSQHTTHKWDAGVVTKDATCEETGTKVYTCTVAGCGETKTETIAATGHDWFSHSMSNPPTCTTNGSWTLSDLLAGNTPTCNTCGATYVGPTWPLVVPAYGHNYVNGICTNCGDYNILRVYGQTRYGTSLAIADQLKKTLNVSQFDSVIIANAMNYPDALSGSYIGALKSAPILLVGDDTSFANVLSYLKTNLKTTGTVYVLGGSSVIKDSYVKQLKASFNDTQVIAGTNRLDTNLKVLQNFGITSDGELIVADASTDTSFADALSASSTGKALMITNRGTANSKGVYTGKLTDAQLTYLSTAANDGTIKKVTVLGGKNAVPSTIVVQLQNIFGKANVTRVYGENRYETSQKVAAKYFTSADYVTLAWGGNFPDALCGGPLAYALKAPLVLTEETASMNKYAVDYTKTLGTSFKVVAFGGVGASKKQLTDAAVKAVKNADIGVYYIAN